MIVDSGAPVLIATSNFIERYIKEMEVKKEIVMEKECNRKFKMGENIYLSNREITLPVRMRTDNDDFMMKMVTVSVVYREDELFLCGLKTLMEWKAAVYYEKCELKFDDSQKRVNIQISGGGHQLVNLETLGEITHEAQYFIRNVSLCLMRVRREYIYRYLEVVINWLSWKLWERFIMKKTVFFKEKNGFGASKKYIEIA